MTLLRSATSAVLLPVKRALMTLAAFGISRCLTGDAGDLRKLLRLERLALHNATLSVFLRRLSRDLDEGTGLGNLLLHVGRNANPRHRRRLIENLFFNWIVHGRPASGRACARSTTGCRSSSSSARRCAATSSAPGCYSALYSKDGELSEAETGPPARRVPGASASTSSCSPAASRTCCGTACCGCSAKYNDIFFLTFTNGTLLDEPLVRRPVAAGQRRAGHQRRRATASTPTRDEATGVYAKIESAMELLSDNGVIFGISVTYTRDNVNVVTDDRFVEHYSDQGAVFAWYFMFMPVGKDPILELVPTPEQRVAVAAGWSELRKRYPMFMADFWNDGPAVGGCLAGGTALPARAEFRPRRAVRLRALRRGQHPRQDPAGGGQLAVLQGHPARVPVQRERQPSRGPA